VNYQADYLKQLVLANDPILGTIFAFLIRDRRVLTLRALEFAGFDYQNLKICLTYSKHLVDRSDQH
jgi:hypothetical protein